MIERALMILQAHIIVLKGLVYVAEGVQESTGAIPYVRRSLLREQLLTRKTPDHWIRTSSHDREGRASIHRRRQCNAP